jgi:hypothetical protein
VAPGVPDAVRGMVRGSGVPVRAVVPDVRGAFCWAVHGAGVPYDWGRYSAGAECPLATGAL